MCNFPFNYTVMWLACQSLQKAQNGNKINTWSQIYYNDTVDTTPLHAVITILTCPVITLTKYDRLVKMSFGQEMKKANFRNPFLKFIKFEFSIYDVAYSSAINPQ